VLLGVIVGAVSSGDMRAQTAATGGASWAWIAPFPLAVGILTLAVFSHLAAVYLILEADDPALREDFRSLALGSSGAVAGLLVVVPLLARRGAPDFFHALLGSDGSVGVVFLAASAALGAFVALLLRAYALARACAAAQAALILVGWGAAQYPFLIRPDRYRVGRLPPATLRILVVWRSERFFSFRPSSRSSASSRKRPF
jgi:cytochrome d ubiquinol oxidase subunit II